MSEPDIDTPDRSQWTVCGRIIGTATGWDQADTFAIVLHDFVPAPNYRGPVADMVTFYLERGLIETYDDDGLVLMSLDLISSIQDCVQDHIE